MKVTYSSKSEIFRALLSAGTWTLVLKKRTLILIMCGRPTCYVHQFFSVQHNVLKVPLNKHSSEGSLELLNFSIVIMSFNLDLWTFNTMNARCQLNVIYIYLMI